jgi:hypothetical protein
MQFDTKKRSVRSGLFSERLFAALHYRLYADNPPLESLTVRKYVVILIKQERL